MSKKSPSIADVARMAGTSISTVSRALNGGYVAKEKRSRIIEAINRSGYTPKYLSNRLPRVCALLRSGFAAPISERILPVLSSVLTQRKVQVLVVSESGGDEPWMLQSIRSMRPDILICLGRLTREHLTLASELGGLIQASDWDDGELHPDITYIAEDSEAAGKLSVEHLASRGHRRVCLVYRGSTSAGSRNLSRGFLQAAQRLGLETEEILVPAGTRLEESPLQASIPERLRRDRANAPTGYVLGRPYFALPLYSAIQAAGLKIPEAASIVGMDFEGHSEHLYPPLTCYRFAGEELGGSIAEAALALLKTPRQPLPPKRIAPTLVERGSVADLSRKPSPARPA